MQHENIITQRNDAVWIKYNMKRLLHKIVQHGKNAVWVKCNTKRLLHKIVQQINGAVWKSAIWKEYNMRKKQHDVQKKCTRIVHYRTQMDNGPFVDRPLYTGVNYCLKGEAVNRGLIEEGFSPKMLRPFSVTGSD